MDQAAANPDGQTPSQQQDALSAATPTTDADGKFLLHMICCDLQ